MACSGGTWGHRMGITLDFMGAQVVLVERACPRRTATCGSAGRKCRPSRSADPDARPRRFTPKVEPRSHHRQGDCSENLPAGAICPNFNSYAAQDGAASQDGSYLIPQGLCGCHGYKATAGWRFGNLIDGAQAEYVLVPDAQGNLAPVPDGLTDEQVLMCPDIMSTGFKGAENANIRIGDTVVVFAQGPIGLCATAGARLMGAATIIAVDGNDHRLDIARKMGADLTLNFNHCDVVDEIVTITGGRGVDASIEALGTQVTFESALRVLKPDGTLSSLGVHSCDLTIPMSAFAAGLGDHRIITALCPGGKERMRRLMNVVASGRIDLGVLVTHQFKLDDIVAAYELFANQRDGVLKVAIKP